MCLLLLSFSNFWFNCLFKILKLYDFSQQERGLHLLEDFDIDEETRFSSVYRGKRIDDSGNEENDDIPLDSHNSETFGGIFGSVIKRSDEIDGGKDKDGARTLANSSSMVSPQFIIFI